MNRGFIGRFLDTFFSLPVLLGLLTMLGFQYYFASNATKQVVRPHFNRDIHFVEHKIRHDRELVCAETDLCEYEFSTVGAVLVGSTFKKHLGQDNVPLRTVHERGQFERDQGVFLLALEEKTPLDYVLDAQKNIEGGVEVSFSTETLDKQWRIGKTFRMYNDSYRVDVILSFVPLKSEVEPLVPRLFVPGPFLGEIDKDKLEGIVQPLGDGRVERFADITDESDRWWNAPAIAGVEDKYFMHALIGYEPGFLKHVFYKKTTSASAATSATTNASKRAPVTTGLSVVLECVPVGEQSEVELDWYFGPKTLRSMEKVDERLGAFLSLGWFSFIGRFLLSALESLYEYLGNYGWAIIVLTLIIRIPLIPFFMYCKRKAAKADNVTRKYAHEIAGINAKYKDDAIMRQDEISKFYEARGTSSMGAMYAMVPQLLMIPVFVSLFGLLNNAVSLYNAPFMGWITNLGASDPYYIIPLVMAAGLVVQQYFAPTNGRESYVMKIVLPVIMFAFLCRFPVGMLLYFLVARGIEIVEDIIKAKIWSV